MKKNNLAKMRLLIIGGTYEARRLSFLLSINSDAEIYYSLSGITGKKALKVSGYLIKGGFGGSGGISDFIERKNIDYVIDASHPYAQRISDNAKKAADSLHCPYLRLLRGNLALNAKNCRYFTGLPDLIRFLPESARIFAALGHKADEIALRRKEVFLLSRRILRATKMTEIRNSSCRHFIYSRPPFSPQQEFEMMKSYRITHLIARYSITNKTLAKFTAAVRLGIAIWFYLPDKRTLNSDSSKVFYNILQLQDFLLNEKAEPNF